ncbi:MAG: winged helix-turn-helix transcriptional regulator [Clostridiales bacterium]|nr:winged helix-turn-helix transcriptional regulator [Clostridiales bacterium]
MLLISFDKDEEKLIDTVISVLDAGRETFAFQEVRLQSEIQHDNLIIDLDRREIIKSGRKIRLTYTEFAIIRLLAQNPGRVFSKEQIYDTVWKEPYLGDYNIVMSHISHIRNKIEDDPSNPVYIQTVWGVGYKFNGRGGSE